MNIMMIWMFSIAIAWSDTPEGGFFDAQTLPVRPQYLERAIQATTYMQSDLEWDTNCSAVVISNDGYVATALHCLHSCLDWIVNLNEIALEQIHKEEDKVYKSVRYPMPIKSPLECPNYAKNIMEFKKLGMKNPKVVWIGKGKQSHANNKLPTLSEDVFDSIKDLTEDVAIVKYEVSQETPCVPVSKAHISPGADVWAVGYPADTARGSKFKKLSISYGKVRGAITEDPLLSALAETLPQELRTILWEREHIMWDQPHILQTSLDGFKGSSGGAILAKSGDLVGVIFAMTDLSTLEYQGSTLYGFRTETLRQRIESELGQEKAREIFSCTLYKN